MKPRTRYNCLLFFGLLLASASLSIAARQPTGIDDKDQHSLGHDFDFPQTLRPPAGALAVQEAQDILATLQYPNHRRVRPARPSGTFALVWFYAKKLAVFLFVNGPQAPSPSSKYLAGPLKDAVGLLESAAEAENAEAISTLASMAFHGTFGYPRNYTEAFEHYQTLASRHGDDTAQQMLGFMYSTGIGDVVPRDQSRALLYHIFAADAGNTRAQMTVAFRYHTGIGTARDCEKSVSYYKKVADKAIEHVRTGPPGGRRLVKELFRLADEEGGVYGEGASYSSAGMYARHGLAPDSDQTMDDYLEYLDLMSRKGDLKATFRLGQYHYEGSRALIQDFGVAKDFFQDIARRYWSTKDGKIRPDVDRELEKLASKAAGYLGSMFLRGEGVEQNFAKAKIWFRRGVENGDALCQHSLGLMHLYGLGMVEDPVKASEYFGAAADQDLPMAQVRLGALLLDQGDIQASSKYFELAARHSNIEAFYYLAELINLGVGRERSCTTAALYYKLVAERAETLHSNIADANDAYELGVRETALVLYMQAAEQGYEAAQANVALILDNTARNYPTLLHSLFPSIFQFTSSRPSEASLALTYWTRSAKQANVDSLVKMGDYYLAGLGAGTARRFAEPTEHEALVLPDPDKAAACYSAAAETQMSAQAQWNLGWMHENGLGGMSRDFHLAKRYYDSAFETNAEAYLPVTLALLKLRVRSWWNGITGGKAKGINAGEADKRRSFTEWLTEFLLAELGEEEREQLLHQQQAAAVDGGADGGAANEWDVGFAGEQGLYDDYGFADESMWEAALFALLAAGLALLVWYRQTVRQQQQQQQQRNGEDSGRLGAQAPNVRDAAPALDHARLADVGAGGVGH